MSRVGDPDIGSSNQSASNQSPSNQSLSKQGMLLFAHGARDPRWAEPFDAVANRVRAAQPEWSIELAYLDFMQPDIRGAGARLASAGCSRVDVVPLFLGAGGHVRKDLPVLLAELEAAYPSVRWQLRRAIGEVDSVIDAMAQAAVAGTLDPASASRFGLVE